MRRMNSEFFSNNNNGEDNFAWLEECINFSSVISSSQNSQASSDYLHHIDSLDLGINPDELMADVLNCSQEIPLSIDVSSDGCVEWELNPNTPSGQASPGSSYSVAYNDTSFVYNNVESNADVEIDGTIVHIPDLTDEFTVNNAYEPVEDVAPIRHSSVDSACVSPCEYVVPLSVSSETSMDDEDEDYDGDDDNLRDSVTSGASCGGSTTCSTSALFSDEYLRTVSVKQLNLRIRELAVSRDVEHLVKKRRRTLKNRGYAHSSRQKRNGRHHEVDERNAELQRRYDGMKRERDAFKREHDTVKRENVILKKRLEFLQSSASVKRE